MIIKWVKPGLALLVMGLVVWLSPAAPIDPWHIFNPKKIATMISALVCIQIFGSVANRLLSARAGAVLVGFFGGLISSTATIASLARKSKIRNSADSSLEMIGFLSATGAMLIEGAALIWTGTSSFHFSALIIFLGPLLASSAMLYFYTRKMKDKFPKPEEIQFRILPLLKLSFFIVSILLLSKLLQNFFGKSGLVILTLLVSFFEIHGSVIANIQLYENGMVTTGLLNSLLAISVMASYLSKLFLISTLGSKEFSYRAFRCTLILFLSLSIVWLISAGLS